MATLRKRPPPPIKQLLVRARWQSVRWARMAGAQTLIAAVLLLLTGALTWHSVDMQQQREQLQSRWHEQQRNAQANKPHIDTTSADLARQLLQFYGFLPSHDAIPDQIKRLLASADKHGLQLAQGDYKALPQPNTAMLRYQIVLPVKADYPKIISFLQSALQEMPSLALESMQLKRANIESSEVEARLQLVIFVQNKRPKTRSKHE